MGALYRRVRPLTFQEVVGQEHVKEPLERAIREGLLAQAYLFSGPRGVGKTTTARLLAMGVGCTGKEKPCGVCEHCLMVREGRHPDVLEIDAASHNSVEDVRELQERLLLSPLMAPKKVFILDEAHMLSKSAFNALLKTLEEPPAHVLFIFATTEPERMPPTILSRTQHFRFRRLSEEEIARKLRRILQEMGREATEEALLLVARLADGAMRDAESLLDRLLLLEGPLTRERVEEAFGLPPKDALFQVARLLAPGPGEREVQEALELARGLYARGFAAKSLISALLEVLREDLLARRLGLSLPELIRGMEALDEVLVEMNRRPDLMGLELALLKLYAAWRPTSEGARLEAPPPPRPQAAPAPPPSGEAPGEPSQGLEARWRDFLQALKPTLRAFLREGRPRLEGDALLIAFPKGKAFHYQKALEKRADYADLALRLFGVKEVEPVLEAASPQGKPGAAFPSGEEVGEKKTPDSPLPRSVGEEGSGPPAEAGPAWDAPASEPPEAAAFPPTEPRAAPSEEDPEGPAYSDPLDEPRLRRLMRLFGARLVQIKPPEEARASEPMSEDEIGGNGI
ncbi:DNA polymerase III subunit gamma/tau [Thermus filiformis]|uniref:DNA polymerase III subunit gamma/tau n=1 Tax=Thermus filiformis TaxID=276 RepID=A0A0A2WWZ0_THEFI|nr:DNA polymerase III subunit gamma/tau [Thermus filiformis]KGQ22800.1 DNA polymerase III subunits gamma and tau [Thermus filiformis]